MSLTQTKNNRGPKTDPWRTTQLVYLRSETEERLENNGRDKRIDDFSQLKATKMAASKSVTVY